MTKLNINDWAEEDRPREKLMRLGAEALTDAELLAILIGSGSIHQNAVQLMQSILADCNNNLNTLGKRSLHELTQYDGMGPAKAVTILAACELGKRRAREKAEERTAISTSEDIYNIMHSRLQDKDVEEAWILLMNQNYKLLGVKQISHGGISDTSVDVRVIMKEALLCNATILALCHNHPSNNATPSREDDRLTKRVQDACNIMRIYFADHLIVCDGSYYSYRDKGRI